MNDLFRFLLLRPADEIAPSDVKLLTPTFTNQDDTRSTVRRKATVLVDRKMVPAPGGEKICTCNGWSRSERWLPHYDITTIAILMQGSKTHLKKNL